MLILLRFICITLMLIAVGMVVPDLKLGGRYLILLEALIATIAAGLFRFLIGEGIPVRERGVLTGLSTPLGLLFIKAFFPGVNLAIVGILSLYLGAVLLEMLLPDYLKKRYQV